MTRRWVCPTCGEGVHAPDRPRRDDVRRYCLPCSAKAGRLVERACPARENARARAVAQRKASAEVRQISRAAARELERRQRENAEAHAREVRARLRAMPITEIAGLRTREAFEEAARRYARLKAWECDLSDCAFTIRMSTQNVHTSGVAYPGRSRRFVVTVGTDIADAHAVILHELAHLAAGPKCGHDARWRGLFQLAASEVIGHHVDVPASADRHEITTVIARALAFYLFPPACLASMGCLCAAHARGAGSEEGCDATE